MSRSALLAGLLAVAGLTGLSPSIAAAAPDQTVLVTRGFDGRPGNGVGIPYADSQLPLMSADGRRVAFTSGAANLWPGPGPVQQRAYLRDLGSAPFVLVSRADGPGGAPSDDGGHLAGFDAWATSITPDGRHVDFEAQLPGDRFGGYYGWRRDVETGTTTLITADEHGTPLWTAGPLTPAGGDRYVLFASRQQVLDDVGAVDAGIYLRDLETGRITLVSRATGEHGAPVGADLLGVSPGGRYVTFRSGDGTLAGGPPAAGVPLAAAFVYLRDVRLGQTILVSRADGRAGRPIASRSYGSAPVTGDGCRVAFDATGSDVAAGSPSTGGSEVYVRDVCRGTTTLISRTPDGTPAATPAPGPYASSDAWPQAMSADGRYVLFGTAALNLADGLRLGQSELYLRDVEGNRTLLVSRADGPGGPPADPGAGAGAMTPDARFIAFTSKDPTFTPDANAYNQIYRRELAPETVPPAQSPPLTCGAIDDPGVGGSAAAPCPGDAGGDDGSGTGAGTPAPPAAPRPVTVTVPGGASPLPAAATTGPATSAPVATVPTLVRAPTLSALTATAQAVRAWVDLPATVEVAVARSSGRHWRTQRTIRLVVKKPGRISVALPRLSHLRYRLTVRALGASGTASPAIVRTLDLRPRKAKKQ